MVMEIDDSTEAVSKNLERGGGVSLAGIPEKLEGFAGVGVYAQEPEDGLFFVAAVTPGVDADRS